MYLLGGKCCYAHGAILFAVDREHEAGCLPLLQDLPAGAYSRNLKEAQQRVVESFRITMISTPRAANA